ncbi:MAG: hypothetical protein ACOCXQ_03660 [Patescibacteria group bacterium]
MNKSKNKIYTAIIVGSLILIATVLFVGPGMLARTGLSVSRIHHFIEKSRETVEVTKDQPVGMYFTAPTSYFDTIRVRMAVPVQLQGEHVTLRIKEDNAADWHADIKLPVERLAPWGYQNIPIPQMEGIEGELLYMEILQTGKEPLLLYIPRYHTVGESVLTVGEKKRPGDSIDFVIVNQSEVSSIFEDMRSGLIQRFVDQPVFFIIYGFILLAVGTLLSYSLYRRNQ